jgi:hypothetical protein
MDQDKITAVQAVVDRVSSWQETATESTIETEIRKGLDEVGVTLDDSQVTALAEAIEDKAGETDAGSVLG